MWQRCVVLVSFQVQDGSLSQRAARYKHLACTAPPPPPPQWAGEERSSPAWHAWHAASHAHAGHAPHPTKPPRAEELLKNLVRIPA